MLTFPLKFSPNKAVSPVRQGENKSNEKLTAQKFNPELTRDF